MTLQRMSGFSNEGGGPIDGVIVSGDVVRDESGSEFRWYEAETPTPLEARNLTWDQFLDVAMATDAVKANAILINLPVVAEYGRKYLNVAGIEYADATNPSARLYRLMQAAKTAGIIDDTFLATFLQTWKAIYP